MNYLIRKTLLKLTILFPSLMRPVVIKWAALHQKTLRKPRWLLIELANMLNVRAEIDAVLLNGMRMRVVANDIVGSAICFEGFFEPETVDFYQAVLSEGSVFLDIGAQVGQYTLLASGIVGKQGRVVGFEPDPQTFRLLTTNIQMNHLEHNTVVVQAAVSNKSGNENLHLSQTQNIGANSLLPPAHGLASGQSVPVACWRLDDYLSANQITKVDLIKIDVEGAELLVLNGAADLLGKPNKPILVVEFCEVTLNQFGATCDMLASELEAMGYRLMVVGVFPLKPYTGPHPEGRAINVAAIPKTLPDKLQHLLG